VVVVEMRRTSFVIFISRRKEKRIHRGGHVYLDFSTNDDDRVSVELKIILKRSNHCMLLLNRGPSVLRGQVSYTLPQCNFPFSCFPYYQLNSSQHKSKLSFPGDFPAATHKSFLDLVGVISFISII